MKKQIQILNGYRLIYLPSYKKTLHGRGYEGYVYEHILCAEKILGRELYENEVVHHLNGDRADNRDLNLLILDRGQHAKLHHWLSNIDIVKDSSITNLRTCKICNITLPTKRHKYYCSKECAFEQRYRRSRIPSIEQLTEDIKTKSWCAIGRKYGVSDNAVRKWAKKYNLPIKYNEVKAFRAKII